MAFSISRYSHYFRPALPLGLDIGQTAIRMVELSQGADRRYRLERHGRLELPAGIVADRQIQHPARLGEHIAALAARLGSKRKYLALALPADAVFTRPMQAPAHIRAAALEAMVTAEAAGYLTLAPDQVRVDHQFSGMASGDDARRDIVIAAARCEQVEDRVAAVEAAGLTPIVLDIDLYAAHAACLRADGGFEMAGQATVALLVCDAARTQIALFDRHQLLHHRELPGCDRHADPAQIATAAARALPLAMPAGMTLSHVFIGGDCPAPRLMQLRELLWNTLMPASEPPDAAFGCSIAQPFSAMATGRAATAAEDDGDDHAGAYLVACGLAMQRNAR